MIELYPLLQTLARRRLELSQRCCSVKWGDDFSRESVFGHGALCYEG